MATSEQTIQEAIRDALRALNNFEDGDVVINDWAVLDQSTDNAPYVVIENSDDWESTQETATPTDHWRIPMTLAVKLGADTWEIAMNNFRDTRQAVINAFNNNGRSAFGQAGVYVPSLRPDGPIGWIYDTDVDPEQMPYATPLFVSQRILVDIQEF